MPAVSERGSELSWRTLAVGAVLGVVFAGTAMYAGTKIAFVDGGNIAAALVAFAMLAPLSRGLPRASEGNIVQTVSSSAAMMAISGGLVGPIAALALGGMEYSLVGVTAWGIAIGVLGCLLAVPLRAAFIERGSLPFPSGVATAEVLDTVYTRGQSAAPQLRLLAFAAALAAALAFARTFFGWLPELWTLPLAVGAIPAAGISLGVGTSPMLVGIGALAGAGTAIALALGAILAWVVIAPRLVAAGIARPDYLSLLEWNLWAGAGLMFGATLGSVAAAWRGLGAAVREMRRARAAELATERRHVVALIGVSALVVLLAHVVFGVYPAVSVLGLVLSILLCAAAARAMGETDNTPAGPLGGFAQIVVGIAAPGGITSPLTAGGIVNGTLMHSAMMLQNWRTGRLVKTSPHAQLIAQLVGVVVGAVACAAAFELIRDGYGLGTEAMPAPAALSWKATAEIVQHGTSALPAYAPLGALAGLLAGIALALAQTRQPRVPSPSALGMAFILPPYLSLTIALGGAAWWLLVRRRKAWSDDYGLALVSGLIGGEAIAGLVIAALLVAGVSAS
jgi:putative OPT family oligopeptide transporter